mmetsp:Transcript_13333/g.20568  ORF Transcript_13333/g.20568 Transcript_13333/m.20568 type:complete len:576 (-) Transcript_13333:83-1810(-)|eukprot:CAMPEP_0201515200 /NCGR_PEP_ID=MMETSP0161_2-20130828/6837_1 /ASSEMBLY_ACC=CAM_ASM_000251 /TAXON_ID=180227 /ORGANISM="Neoparamoeba aestuarina, Strain SoJaBio B1-5/56/2" /LENGTH=575 /DNA_ID=CAMNT_0047911967 /DNA_START=74 /DNA_END=1801 /DNA_ORIENTATION=+
MQSFFENEIENNSLLHFIKNDPNFVNLILQSKASIFVPQNVSLDAINLRPEFARVHVFISNPKNKTQFISYGGVHGRFKNDRQLLQVLAVPKPNFELKQDIHSLFREAQVLFNSSANSRSPVIVLREGTWSIGDATIPVVLLSEPLFTPVSCIKSEGEESKQQIIEPVPQRSKPPLMESQSLPATYVSQQLNDMKEDTIADTKKTTPKRRHSLEGKNEPPAPTPAPVPNKQSAQFLQLINRPEAKEIANAVRKFVQKFMQAPPAPAKHGQVVRNFLDITEKQIAIHPLWKGKGGDPESTQEALEKLVTSKLFTKIFCPTEEDKEKDKELSNKMARLNRFLQPKHLDIKPNFIKQDFITQAVAELCKINDFKSPRDKMVCIMNCCKVIYKMLNSITSSSNMEAAGADDFLPMLIYVLIRSKVPSLHSNTQYIRRFRHPSKLMTETGYYFTHFESTIHFISNADHERFSMDKEAWEKYMYGNSVDFTLVQDADELRVGDVADLLTAYQRLHEENARLKKENEELKATVRREASQPSLASPPGTGGVLIPTPAPNALNPAVGSLHQFSTSPNNNNSLI